MKVAYACSSTLALLRSVVAAHQSGLRLHNVSRSSERSGHIAEAGARHQAVRLSRAQRKRIVECVGLIRSKVKDGRLVLQHNTEYGFVRNLVGGSTIAALISVVNVVIFVYFHPDSVALTLSIVLAVIYLFIASLGKYLIRRYGYRYSKVLIQEYVHL